LPSLSIKSFDHLIFAVPPLPEDEVLPLLDRYAALAEQLRGG
jgi:hypothetical protein